jgi:hypothetical protein
MIPASLATIARDAESTCGESCERDGGGDAFAGVRLDDIARRLEGDYRIGRGPRRVQVAGSLVPMNSLARSPFLENFQSGVAFVLWP